MGEIGHFPMNKNPEIVNSYLMPVLEKNSSFVVIENNQSAPATTAGVFLGALK